MYEHRVHNEFDFVKAFKIRHFRLVPGFDQRVITRRDQFAQAAAEDGLLA